MKIFDEFSATIDSAKTPTERLKEMVPNVTLFELQSCTDDTQRERFAAAALGELAKAATDAIETGNLAALDGHVVIYRLALRKRLQYERERGESKPITVQSELARVKATLHHFLFRGPEVAALELKMKNDERIVAITWGHVETDKQVIRRSDLPAISRPQSFRNGNSWRSSFVSDAEVQRAIEAEMRQSSVANTAGVASRWID